MTQSSVPAESPEDVVRRVFGALKAGDWQLVAESAHEESLERFRRWELRFLEIQTGARPLTPDELGDVIPKAPGPVLDWFMDQETAALARERQGWPPGLLGVDNVGELAALPGAELFRRWLAASYAGEIPWQVAPSERADLNRAVIGCAREVRVSAMLAHVVYRQHDDPESDAAVRVTTVRYAPGGWKIDAADTALLLPAHLF